VLKSELLYELLKQGESISLDFKQTITAHKIARTLVAFANTKGGTILIGVADNKHILGIDPEEEKFVIEEATNKYCTPKIAYEIEVFEEDKEKMVLAVYVQEGKEKPYFALDLEGVPHAFIRQGDKNKEL
jgi:predicted HTH transcriptional regulator